MKTLKTKSQLETSSSHLVKGRKVDRIKKDLPHDMLFHTFLMSYLVNTSTKYFISATKPSLPFSLSLSVSLSAMEKTDSERRIVERREEKRKENGGHVVYHPVISAVERCPSTDVKLAAIAVGLNIRLKAADMPAGMQERAFRYARLLLDAAATDTRPNPTHIALALKKV